jgi:hypothetical protein
MWSVSLGQKSNALPISSESAKEIPRCPWLFFIHVKTWSPWHLWIQRFEPPMRYENGLKSVYLYIWAISREMTHVWWEISLMRNKKFQAMYLIFMLACRETLVLPGAENRFWLSCFLYPPARFFSPKLHFLTQDQIEERNLLKTTLWVLLWAIRLIWIPTKSGALDVDRFWDMRYRIFFVWITWQKNSKSFFLTTI